MPHTPVKADVLQGSAQCTDSTTVHARDTTTDQETGEPSSAKAGYNGAATQEGSKTPPLALPVNKPEAHEGLHELDPLGM